ncbi:hypothetical protein F5Y04DRAFT_208509 [Hypomontagnella monticulosa]|nr:hypothetical protein F5Y04DRAFT_208509 [Hypomontagnella monticulosa]
MASHSHPEDSLYQIECVSCLEGDEELRQLGCNCYWCRTCIRRYVNTALRDRTSWPPACHGHAFELEDVKWAGPSDLAEKFDEVLNERNQSDPLYCANPRCSALLDQIGLADGQNIVFCNVCKESTCRKCKGMHGLGYEDCKWDGIDPGLKQVAEEENWKRCPHCGRMVEKKFGCDLLR